MPSVVTSGKPFILGTDATLTIDGVEVDCITNKISLKPSTTMQTATTICGAVDYPGQTKWALEAILYQSFEADGAYDVLSKAYFNRPATVPFTLSFHAGAPAVGNPEFSGNLIPQAFDISDSQAGALVEVDFTWSLDGEPLENTGTTPVPIGTAAAASGTTTRSGNGKAEKAETATAAA